MEHKEQEVLHHVTSESGARRTPRRFHRNNTQYMVTLAFLVALIVVLQYVGGLIPPINGVVGLSFVLIPIVIGGLVLGVKAGAILGLVFGIFVFVWCGVLGREALTTILYNYNPIMTAIICVVKGVGAGVVPPLLHRLLYHRFPRVSTFVVTAAAPITNTALFLLGMTFMLEPLRGANVDVLKFFFYTIPVCNFLPELVINLVAAPAIYRIVHAVAKQQRH